MTIKITREDEAGDFDGKGNMKSPAKIVLTFSNMDLGEYQRINMLIEESFPKMTVNLPARLKKLIINTGDPVHSGSSPTESLMEVR